MIYLYDLAWLLCVCVCVPIRVCVCDPFAAREIRGAIKHRPLKDGRKTRPLRVPLYLFSSSLKLVTQPLFLSFLSLSAVLIIIGVQLWVREGVQRGERRRRRVILRALARKRPNIYDTRAAHSEMERVGRIISGARENCFLSAPRGDERGHYIVALVLLVGVKLNYRYTAKSSSARDNRVQRPRACVLIIISRASITLTRWRNFFFFRSRYRIYIRSSAQITLETREPCARVGKIKGNKKV